MATLEIDLASEEQAQLEQKAQRAGLPLRDWVRRSLLDRPWREPLTDQSDLFFTTDDGAEIKIPDPPAPGQTTPSLRPIGLCDGEFTVPDDFDDPLPDEIIRQFEGR